MTNASNTYSNTSAFSHFSQLEFKSLLALWFRNYQTRKTLKGIEAHRLHDIGIDHAQAEAESHKPFWR